MANNIAPRSAFDAQVHDAGRAKTSGGGGSPEGRKIALQTEAERRADKKVAQQVKKAAIKNWKE